MAHRAIGVLIGIGLGVLIGYALSARATVTYIMVERPIEERKEVLTQAPESRWTQELIEHAIRRMFPEAPETFVRIADCESDFIPTAHNEKTHDGGIFQINETYHGEKLKELGLDPFDVEDNLKYARMLYEESGTKPWNASKKCWSQR